jgi:hypothetical protein
VTSESRRLVRERRTLDAMIALYCGARHESRGALCADCAAVRDYAQERLASCPFGALKPVCSACTVHCYQPAMRERIREVMRVAGPRMMLRHPVLAVMHLRDSRRQRG